MYLTKNNKWKVNYEEKCRISWQDNQSNSWLNNYLYRYLLQELVGDSWVAADNNCSDGMVSSIPSIWHLFMQNHLRLCVFLLKGWQLPQCDINKDQYFTTVSFFVPFLFIGPCIWQQGSFHFLSPVWHSQQTWYDYLHNWIVGWFVVACRSHFKIISC